MPTYDFKCEDCGHVFELFLTFTQQDSHPAIRCPKCSSEQIQRVWTAPVTIGAITGASGERSPVGGMPACGCGFRD